MLFNDFYGRLCSYLLSTQKMLAGAVRCPFFLSLSPGYSVPVFSRLESVHWSDSAFSAHCAYGEHPLKFSP